MREREIQRKAKIYTNTGSRIKNVQDKETQKTDTDRARDRQFWNENQREEAH